MLSTMTVQWAAVLREEVSPLLICRIAVRPGIDEVGFPEDGALNAEQVGVPVSRADGTAEGPHIEDQMVGMCLPSAPHDGVPPSAKRREGIIAGGAGSRASKALSAFGPEEPGVSGASPPAAQA